LHRAKIALFAWQTAAIWRMVEKWIGLDDMDAQCQD
jgi:hypothetical protein